MYHIAVCDDEREVLQYIGQLLVDEFHKQGIEVSIDKYDNGQKFLNAFTKHIGYDVVFMDIDMPDCDGIEICKKIRNLSGHILCVFISNRDDLVFQTFEIHPFRFVRKSEIELQVHQLILDICKEWGRVRSLMLHIEDASSLETYQFEIARIIYVEAQLGNTKIVTQDGEFTMKIKLSDVELMLASHNFLKPHRSYLINYKYVYRISKTKIELSNGYAIPVSRKRIDEIRRDYMHLIIGG